MRYAIIRTARKNREDANFRPIKKGEKYLDYGMGYIRSCPELNKKEKPIDTTTKEAKK